MIKSTHSLTRSRARGLKNMIPMFAAAPARVGTSRASPSLCRSVSRSPSLLTRMSANGYLAKKGKGLRMMAVSMSVMKVVKPMPRNVRISWIFSWPILKKVLVPQPKSLVGVPLDMEKVWIPRSCRATSISSSIAPTR